jgi:hypothetical protein
MKKSIHELVRDAKQSYEHDEIELVEGLVYNQYETLKEVEYMTNNAYIKGEKDENDNYKPFYNITTRLCNNQKAAEDIDRKDMVISTDNPKYFGRAFLLNKFNQSWMRKANFAQVLNDFTETRGKYGGVLIKKTQRDGDLFLDVVDWHNVTVDQVDISAGVVIENKYYTPADLVTEAQARGWDMEQVKNAIELYTQHDQQDDLDGQNTQKEAISGYILVREVYGTIEKRYLDDDAEPHEYSMQMHVVAGSELYDENRQDRGVSLYAAEIDENPFRYLPYRKRDAMAKKLGWGIVEEARHAQIWTNYGVMAQKNALDYGSKVVLQTASTKVKGKNVLKDFKNGQILEHEEGKPLSGVDLTPGGIQFLPQWVEQWDAQITKALNVSDVSTGQDSQSNMPYRLGALLDQNAQSVYNQRREEASIFWNEIYQDWVIPYLIKQLKKTDRIVAELEPEEMMQIDDDFSNYEADQVIIQNILDGQYDALPVEMRLTIVDEERTALKMERMKTLRRGKNKREFSYPKGYWDEDIVFQLDVQISNEQKQKQAFLETRSNLLTLYLANRDFIKSDSAARKIFEQLAEAAGMSTIDLDLSPTPSAPGQPPQQPQQMQQQEQAIQPAKPV